MEDLRLADFIAGGGQISGAAFVYEYRQSDYEKLSREIGSTTCF